MKAKYLFIGLALASLLCACSRDEESLFDKSAAERAQEALTNADQVLIAPANGWEMLYFANTGSRGYNVLVKFDANGRVSATAKNALTTGNRIVTDSESTWEVKLDYGPILTFDTYNEVLHAWADPRDNGDGYLGDYEFLILHADANYVKLKGKKHGGYMHLYPLKESVTPEDYFAEVEALQQKLFGNANILEWSSNGVTRQLHDGQSGLFSLTELGQPIDAENKDIYPLAVNRSGVQLSYPIGDSKDDFFRFEDGKLVSNNATISACAPERYFSEYIRLAGGKWSVSLKDMNAAALEVLSALNADIQKKYNNKKRGGTTDISFTFDGNDNFVLAYTYIGKGTKESTFNYIFDLVVEGSNLKLTYKEPAETSGQNVITALPELGQLLELFNGEFQLLAAEPFNPTLGIKMTQQTNTDLWYNITGVCEE